MQKMILAGAALVLALALGGCATGGSTATFASTDPFLTKSTSLGGDTGGDIGHAYRVYPGDETIPATDPNAG